MQQPQATCLYFVQPEAIFSLVLCFNVSFVNTYSVDSGHHAEQQLNITDLCKKQICVEICYDILAMQVT